MLNITILIGRLADVPKTSETKNGTKVATFSLPLFHSYVPNGKEEKTEWIQCEAIGGLANVVENAKKGTLVAIRGELYKNTWQDENNQWQSRSYVKIDSFRFLESKSSSEQRSGNENTTELQETPENLEQPSYNEEAQFFEVENFDEDFLNDLKKL